MNALTALKVAEAALLAENKKSAHRSVGEDCSGAQVPDHGVTHQVDLAVVLHPEVLRENVYENDKCRDVPLTLTIPRRRRGHASGRESYVWRSVKPALVVHITF